MAESYVWVSCADRRRAELHSEDRLWLGVAVMRFFFNTDFYDQAAVRTRYRDHVMAGFTLNESLDFYDWQVAQSQTLEAEIKSDWQQKV